MIERICDDNKIRKIKKEKRTHLNNHQNTINPLHTVSLWIWSHLSIRSNCIFFTLRFLKTLLFLNGKLQASWYPSLNENYWTLENKCHVESVHQVLQHFSFLGHFSLWKSDIPKWGYPLFRQTWYFLPGTKINQCLIFNVYAYHLSSSK